MEGELLKAILGAGRDIPWPALTAISFFVSAYLYKAKEKCSEERLQETRDLISGLNTSSASYDKLSENIAQRSNTILEVARLQVEQTKTIETATAAVLAKLNEICGKLAIILGHKFGGSP